MGKTNRSGENQVIRSILNKYRQYSIAKKLLIMLLFGSIIPVMLIEVITCAIAMNTLIRQTDSLIEGNMKLSQKGLEDFFAEYDSIIMSIYTENKYATQLEKLNVWDSRDYYLIKNQLEDDLQNIAYLHSEILGIAVVTQKKECIMFDSITNSSLNSFCFPEKEENWLDIAKQTFQDTQTVYSNVIQKEQEDGTVRNVVYLAHRIADVNNYRHGTVGSIIICLDEADIREKYAQVQESDASMSFLCDEKGNIISSTDQNLLGTNIFMDDTEDGVQLFDQTGYGEIVKEAINNNHIMDTRYYSIFTKPVMNERFVHVSLRDDRELLKDFKYIIEVIILLTILIILSICVIMIRFANSIQVRVEKITSAMDLAYKGDYTVQIDNKFQDEFGVIAKHFNHMVKKIDQSGKMEKEALLREKNAELKALEAQINPHFLYNTLDAINWVAIENEQFQLSKMLKSLAMILRYSIHKSNSVVEIENEIDYLKKYIYLQQQRFSFSFHCILNVDEEILKLKMHKLLFQPLVENAIIHGFPGKTGNDMITISIDKIDEKHLKIEVRDNGKGMSPELVKELNEYEYTNSTIEESIGVRNVIMRIKYYYGMEGSFQIESDENGTTVTAQILYES